MYVSVCVKVCGGCDPPITYHYTTNPGTSIHHTLSSQTHTHAQTRALITLYAHQAIFHPFVEVFTKTNNPCKKNERQKLFHDSRHQVTSSVTLASPSGDISNSFNPLYCELVYTILIQVYDLYQTCRELGGSM